MRKVLRYPCGGNWTRTGRLFDGNRPNLLSAREPKRERGRLGYCATAYARITENRRYQSNRVDTRKNLVPSIFSGTLELRQLLANFLVRKRHKQGEGKETDKGT